MAKKSNNVKKSESKKKTKPRRSKASTAMTTAPMHLVHQICSVTNPFCPEAINAKWPDNTNYKTLPWSSYGTQQQTCVTDAAGNFARMYVGSPLFRNQNNPTVTGTSIDFGATLSTISGFPTNVIAWRITSWGVKVQCTASSNVAFGLLKVRTFNALKLTTLNVMDIDSAVADSTLDQPLSRLIGKDTFVIPMPLSDSARRFQPYDSSVTAISGLDLAWQTIVLTMTGQTASSSANGVITYPYYHFELIVDDTSTNRPFASDNVKESVIVKQGNENVLTKVGNFIEGTAQSVDNVIKSKTFKYLTSAAAYLYYGPAAAIASYGAAGMIKDVD